MGRTLSLIFAVAVVCGLLVFQATRSSATVMRLPSELVEVTSSERVRIAGRVAQADISYQTTPSLQLKFAIIDPPSKDAPLASAPADMPPVSVVHPGVKPDMFAVGRDVILEGYMKDGVLHADHLLTQCPSKYEAPDPSTVSYSTDTK